MGTAQNLTWVTDTPGYFHTDFLFPSPAKPKPRPECQHWALGPNTLDPLAVHFPHSSLTPSSHCLPCLARDTCVYVGGGEQRASTSRQFPGGKLQGGELCPQSPLTQTGCPGMPLPSQTTSCDMDWKLIKWLCSQDQTTAAKNSLGQCKLQPEFPFLSWLTVLISLEREIGNLM